MKTKAINSAERAFNKLWRSIDPEAKQADKLARQATKEVDDLQKKFGQFTKNLFC